MQSEGENVEPTSDLRHEIFLATYFCALKSLVIVTHSHISNRPGIRENSICVVKLSGNKQWWRNSVLLMSKLRWNPDHKSFRASWISISQNSTASLNRAVNHFGTRSKLVFFNNWKLFVKGRTYDNNMFQFLSHDPVNL